MGVMYSLLLGWRIHVCHMLVSVTLDIRKSLVVALFLCVFPVTTHPYQHRAVPKRSFEWRPADCIPDLPWSAGNWRCGNRPRRTFLSGSTPTPSV